jgi:hypothetical protein
MKKQTGQDNELRPEMMIHPERWGFQRMCVFNQHRMDTTLSKLRPDSICSARI